MKRRAAKLILALAALAAVTCAAWAAAGGESLLSLSYLRDTFLPQAVRQGEEAAGGKLQGTYDTAKKELDAFQQTLDKGGAGGLSSDVLAPREWREGDKVTLPTGSSFLLTEGTVSLSHGGAVIDVTAGAELASGSRPAAGHRCLVGEDTQATLTVQSGGARLAVQGSYRSSPSGTDFPAFYDVAAGSWYHDAVRYVYDQELFQGTDEHHFAPDLNMDRAMMMTVLYRAAGAPAGELAAASVSYADVPSNAWYAPYVKWGGARGITTGTGPNTFSPGLAVTREQAVSFLYRYTSGYLGKPQTERADLSRYQDAGKVSSWAEEALSWAVAKGIITSTSATELVLNPQGNATRAQMAVMLRNFAEKVL